MSANSSAADTTRLLCARGTSACARCPRTNPSRHLTRPGRAAAPAPPARLPARGLRQAQAKTPGFWNILLCPSFVPGAPAASGLHENRLRRSRPNRRAQQSRLRPESKGKRSRSGLAAAPAFRFSGRESSRPRAGAAVPSPVSVPRNALGAARRSAPAHGRRIRPRGRDGDAERANRAAAPSAVPDLPPAADPAASASTVLTRPWPS